MKKKDFIYSLILADYSGKLNQQQKLDLEYWIGLSPVNKEEYLKVKDILTYSDNLKLMRNIDTGKDLIEIKNKLNRKIRHKKMLALFQKVAAVLFVPFFLYSLWSVFSLLKEPEANITVMKSTETSYGVHTQFVLNDGTEVYLNSGSKLTYPDKFIGKNRNVVLTGEAFFHVKSDKKHPFFVDLNGYKVKVTGTSFDISNYPEDRKIYTYLYHGKISFLTCSEFKKIKDIPLKDNQIMVLNKHKNKYSIKDDVGNGNKYMAWMNGILKFRNDSPDYVAARLGRWFNAEILFDKSIKESEYVFTATFKKESLLDAIKLLAYSTPIKYKIIPGVRRKDASFTKTKVIISKK